MNEKNFLYNEICYFIDKPIYIVSVYRIFNLAKVHFINDKDYFFIDINFISLFPYKYESSISIKLLGVGGLEQ